MLARLASVDRGDEGIVRVIAFLRYAFGRFPLALSLTALLLVAVGFLEAIALLSLAPVVDVLLEGAAGETSDVTRRLSEMLGAVGLSMSLGTLLVLFLSVNVAKAGVQALSVYAIVRTKYALLRDLMRGTFEDCLGARWAFFTTREQGTLLNLFVRELMVVGDAFGAVARFVATIIQLGLYVAVPLWVSWRLTGLSVGAGLLLVWPFAALGRVNYRLGRENVDATNALAAVFHETFGAAKVVLAYGSQPRMLALFDRVFNTHRRITVRWQTLTRSIPVFYAPLGLTVVVLALLVARQLQVPLSETAIVLYALLRVVPAMGPLVEEKNGFDVFFASYERVIELRAAARRERQPTGQRAFNGFDREIVFERVSFTHPGRPPALTEIEACIPKGRLTAFVGESGAGKSTLVDLLIGLHTPQTGRIVIDGRPMSDIDGVSYRRRLGYVPQESVLFNMSIRDNIRWAFEEATDEDIATACRLAHAAEFIDELPDGYDTVVGDRGVRLSGGQVQRLALARAIVRKPELLVLDEATSSLDSASERLIQQAIESVARETTVVAIAHRLSTIVRADHIYVLSRGRVVEHGSYGDLCAEGATFSRMVEMQSLGASS
ncbi:MAG TPA: ABC transporter ATP-binding protein [Vicinamibacterales bacterium]|nr:ABC transporter ATP-binding protein [Vicinamibacterales bacterium]